ncbi:TPA: TetR/AcrR family transcriptional regulator [Photobacterium damselae]
MDMVIKRTRTRLSPEKRREQLLNSALDVFARRGIGRGGHADIAEMANVSVATVFNYFPTREDLVEQVLIHVESRFNKLLTHSLNDEMPTAKAKLTNLTDCLIKAVIEQHDWLKVWFEWSTSVRDDIWPLFIKTNKNNLQKLTSVFEQGLTAGEFSRSQSASDLAHMFHGTCYVLYLQTHLTLDPDIMQRQADSYLQSL